MLGAACISSCLSIYGQKKRNCVPDAILSSYSARSFNSRPVSEKELEIILACGIKAPSSMNSQLWKFTVVRNHELAIEVLPEIKPGNAIIVISGPETDLGGINADIDCAIAMSYMYIAAQGMGLASHIYVSPIFMINSDLKEKLEIPPDYRAILVIRIGNTDDFVDGVSTASTRHTLKEIVTYK